MTHDQTPIEPNGFWRRAIESPDRPAIVDADERTISYGELFARVNRFSHLLRAAGLRAGDHATFVLGRRAEVFEVVLACAQLGIWYTPASSQLAPDELAHILVDSGARVVIGDESAIRQATLAADAAAIPPSHRLRFGTGDGWVDVRRSAAVHPPSLPENRQPGLPLWYTSGTTGRPKGVMQRQPSAAMVELTQSAVDHAAAYEWSERDVALVQGPLYHAGPLVSAVTMLHQGGLVVIMDKWSPLRCLELIERYGVTASMMVPTMLHRLLLLADDTRRQFHLGSLRPNGIMVGGARCPAHIKTAMIEWWGPVFVESYGGSEATFSRITSTEALAHPGSVGRGRPGVMLRIIDDDGNDCPPGAVGTIYARFDDATAHRPAYLNAPDKTADSYVGEYFTLGDMGYVDQDGWLFLVDRRSDLIVSGGANVYPAEVERVLGAHDAVDDVVVIGVPDDEWGPRRPCRRRRREPVRRGGPRTAGALSETARAVQVPEGDHVRARDRPQRDGQGLTAQVARAIPRHGSRRIGGSRDDSCTSVTVSTKPKCGRPHGRGWRRTPRRRRAQVCRSTSASRLRVAGSGCCTTTNGPVSRGRANSAAEAGRRSKPRSSSKRKRKFSIGGR